ncbi:MAG: D-alanine--D-alanine ligase [Tenericutes bacterium]|nr:D-alanine--D-alanine ligase [Bacilli bacterium]NLV90632.1 D-alanine--D-alanine ligase [Mycoplasmatota bacterium]
MKIKIGVIFGGESVEHEISVISAIQAMKALDEEKYEIVPIYISKDREWYTGDLLKDIDLYKDFDNLKKYAKNIVLYNKEGSFVLQSKKGLKKIVNEIDLVFPIMHGTNGEDGSIQGYLNMLGIPYAESNLYAATIGQDKVFQKQILQSEGLPVADYTWFFDNEYLEDFNSIKKRVKEIGYPVIVKPSRLGSSIGIKIAKNEEVLKSAIDEAIRYDDKILIEKMINNLVELNCAVLGNKEQVETSLIEEVLATDELLSYKDKYIGEKKTKGMLSTNRIIPADISKKTEKEIYELSKKTFRSLNFSGIVRIDYLMDCKTNKIYINEVNTIPGSLSFYLWDKENKNYTKLLDEIINIAIKDYKTKSNKTYSFEINILKNYSGLKGKKGKLKF